VEPKTVSVNLRMPSALRDRLVKLAQFARRSMNTEIVERLHASAAGGGHSSLLEAIEMPRAVRVRCPNTTAAVRNFLTACAELDADRVVLMARRDPNNDAQLVALVHAPHVTALMDDSSLSLARPPRVAEVTDLIRGLARLDLLASARFAAEYCTDTRGMAADTAAAMVADHPLSALHLPTFARLLAGGREVDVQDMLATNS
jgi:hypothetical protein